jgi:hypothetical protein
MKQTFSATSGSPLVHRTTSLSPPAGAADVNVDNIKTPNKNDRNVFLTMHLTLPENSDQGGKIILELKVTQHRMPSFECSVSRPEFVVVVSAAAAINAGGVT